MKIILFGMPGSGKDTQANLLVKKFNLKHISPGNIFRTEMENNTSLGKKIKTIMNSGKFVDDKTTCEIIEKELSDNFVLNGFPRNLYQAKWFDEYCINNNITIDKYIYLDITEQIAISRIKKRALIENRKEDDDKVIVKRLDIFKKETQPCIEYYKNKYQFVTLQGNLHPDLIFKQIQMLVGNSSNFGYF